jgi:hypothetical protein
LDEVSSMHAHWMSALGGERCGQSGSPKESRLRE